MTDEIKELDDFFKGRALPKVFTLYGAIRFTDLPKYVNSMLTILKDGTGLPAAMVPRIADLQDIKQILQAEKKPG